MARVFFLLLILANGLFFAWSQGYLAVYGLVPQRSTEPQRLQQQIRPEAIRLLGAKELAELQEQARPRECWQAGPLDDAQVAALRPVLVQHLQAGDWQLDALQQQPDRWIVYMGRYPNEEALLKKRSELANMHLKMEPLRNPALEIGLSLGGFDSQEAAAAELARLSQRGIRTARVVQESEARQTWQLKLPAVDKALQSRLDEVKPALGGHSLKPCAS